MAEDTKVTDQQSDGSDAQSHEDQGAASASGVDETTTTSQDSDTDADATDDTSTTDDLSTQLLSEAEQDAINAIEDPAKREKAFNRAWTQKTQRLATERKALAPLKALKDALDADGPGALRQLAEQYGLEIRDPKDTTAAAASVDLTKTITDLVKGSLGPEYEDLADRLAPAILEAAKAVVADTTKPLQTRQEELVRESALRESTAVLDAFGKTHPDWKQHEPRMLDLSKGLQPGVDAQGKPTMSEAQYLDHLYTLATKDRAVGEATKKVITRMQKSADAASKDAGGVTADKVAERPTGPISFDEAARLARQGIRLE